MLTKKPNDNSTPDVARKTFLVCVDEGVLTRFTDGRGGGTGGVAVKAVRHSHISFGCTLCS